jgi:hypothetical protein
LFPGQQQQQQQKKQQQQRAAWYPHENVVFHGGSVMVVVFHGGVQEQVRLNPRMATHTTHHITTFPQGRPRNETDARPQGRF